MTTLRYLLLGLILMSGAESSAGQESSSRCADCHFAAEEAPRVDHLMDWDRSAHGRERVGCDACHGGDPTTYETLLAHRGLLSSSNPASPVHRTHLPKTCGKCHIGQFVEFQKSRHYALLQEGTRNGPTCSTCHGEVAAHLLSPRGLGKRCLRCHGEGRNAARPDDPAAATNLLEGILKVREQLRSVSALIRRIEDAPRRQGFSEEVLEAEMPLVEAVTGAHSFSLEAAANRLEVARARVDALLLELANPAP